VAVPISILRDSVSPLILVLKGEKFSFRYRHALRSTGRRLFRLEEHRYGDEAIFRVLAL
jgi:hypothetical protein